MKKLYQKFLNTQTSRIMTNYDHDVLGIGNPHHPANQMELDFPPQTLDECISYLNEHNDSDPLIQKIDELKDQMNKGKQLSVDLIIELRKSGLNGAANQLCKIRDLFKYE